MGFVQDDPNWVQPRIILKIMNDSGDSVVLLKNNSPDFVNGWFSKNAQCQIGSQ